MDTASWDTRLFPKPLINGLPDNTVVILRSYPAVEQWEALSEAIALAYGIPEDELYSELRADLPGLILIARND